MLQYSPLKIRGMVDITYDRGETEFSGEIALKIHSVSSGCLFLKNFYETRKQAELHHLIFEKPLSTVSDYFVVNKNENIFNVAFVGNFCCLEKIETLKLNWNFQLEGNARIILSIFISLGDYLYMLFAISSRTRLCCGQASGSAD